MRRYNNIRDWNYDWNRTLALLMYVFGIMLGISIGVTA